jgi:maleate cis-trans isomerase
MKKLSTRTIDHFNDKEQQTIMFACNLFGIDRQVYYRRIIRKNNKEAKAIEVVSMIHQVRKSLPRFGVSRPEIVIHKKYWRSSEKVWD